MLFKDLTSGSRFVYASSVSKQFGSNVFVHIKLSEPVYSAEMVHIKCYFGQNEVFKIKPFNSILARNGDCISISEDAEVILIE